MRTATTLAALMARYARAALVLLYALQVAVLFRDQLIHLYHAAMAAVHRDGTVAEDGRRDATGIVDAVVDGAKRIFGEERPHRIAAAHGAQVMVTAIIEGGHGEGHHGEHHHPNEEKCRERRHRRTPDGLRPLANLFERILRSPAPAGTEEAHHPFDLERSMRFAAA